jgi:cytochrome c nitrite reductase small subunit
MLKNISDFFFGKLTKFRVVMFVLLGIMIGLGLTTFRLSNAISYLSDEPEACINCHVMTPQYSTWLHSSHRERASCNDCHVPHDNIFKKYWFKANDGLRHSFMFTFRLEPQVIKINSAGKEVMQDNCIRCHESQVSAASIINVDLEKHMRGDGHLCWDCHREVPHGRVHSQSSTPFSRVPPLNPVLPDWMNTDNEENQFKK